MAQSMTGYGVGKASHDGLSVSAEIRCVNNRFLDLSFRTPRALYSRESEMRELIQGRLHRGRVSLAITEEWSEDHGPEIKIDRPRIRQYHRQLQELRDELGLKDEVRLEHLLSMENILAPSEDDDYRETLWSLTREAVIKALDSLIVTAQREGAALRTDMNTRLAGMELLVERLQELAKTQVLEYRQRLTQRLEELLGDERLDRNRLELEIAVAADRLDITEEIVRLQSHLSLFKKTIAEEGSIGKTLGFVLQEMGREANTIGSKSWMIDISQTAIRIKEILEQIREQLQNIE